MDTRAKRATVVVLAAVTAIGAIGIPLLMLNKSTAYFEDSPCGSVESPRIPTEEFLSHIERLDRLARLPWTAAATGVATNGAHACLEVFTGQCSALRDDAVEAARVVLTERLHGTGEAGASAADWRRHLDESAVVALCNNWSDWRSWLTSEGLDAAGACPLCSEVR